MKSANMTLQTETGGYVTQPQAYLETKLSAARQLLRAWRHRARSREVLSGLSPRLLEDVGIGSGEAREEAAKPFWRA